MMGARNPECCATCTAHEQTPHMPAPLAPQGASLRWAPSSSSCRLGWSLAGAGGGEEKSKLNFSWPGALSFKHRALHELRLSHTISINQPYCKATKLYSHLSQVDTGPTDPKVRFFNLGLGLRSQHKNGWDKRNENILC